MYITPSHKLTVTKSRPTGGPSLLGTGPAIGTRASRGVRARACAAGRPWAVGAGVGSIDGYHVNERGRVRMGLSLGRGRREVGVPNRVGRRGTGVGAGRRMREGSVVVKRGDRGLGRRHGWVLLVRVVGRDGERRIRGEGLGAASMGRPG